MLRDPPRWVSLSRARTHPRPLSSDRWSPVSGSHTVHIPLWDEGRRDDRTGALEHRAYSAVCTDTIRQRPPNGRLGSTVLKSRRMTEVGAALFHALPRRLGGIASAAEGCAAGLGGAGSWMEAGTTWGAKVRYLWHRA